MNMPLLICCILMMLSCNPPSFDADATEKDTSQYMPLPITDTTFLQPVSTDTTIIPYNGSIDTRNVTRTELVQYAQQLSGVPYKYASTDPAQGFDCSGFITYVFNHFNIAVPRSSVDFTNVGIPVSVSGAKAGDLILFNGTDSAIKVVGHMGIVVENTDTLKFIHSSSGKANGVTITPLNNYYYGRFVKVISIFK